MRVRACACAYPRARVLVCVRAHVSALLLLFLGGGELRSLGGGGRRLGGSGGCGSPWSAAAAARTVLLAEGGPIVAIESTKTESKTIARSAGTVKLMVSEGELVEAGSVLLTIE